MKALVGIVWSQHFSYGKSMGIFSRHQGTSYSAIKDRIRPKFEPFRYFIVVLIIYKIQSIMKALEWSDRLTSTFQPLKGS